MAEKQITERYEKKSSRTFTMNDREYQALTDLAARRGITRTHLILALVEDETKRLDDQI